MSRANRRPAFGLSALTAVALGLALLPASLQAADPPVAADAAPSPEGVEFFEKHIRPLLTKHCYECHSAESKTVQGEFRLDTRESIRRGGPSGPAVVPGDPSAGEFMSALRHEGYEMPPAGKLPEAEIALFEQWIKMGAPDPRDGSAQATTGIDLAKARQGWPYQPPKASEPPAVRDTSWPKNEVDRFVLAALEAQNLKPVGPATKRQLIRRATFDLIGLPPEPAEVALIPGVPRPGRPGISSDSRGFALESPEKSHKNTSI